MLHGIASNFIATVPLIPLVSFSQDFLLLYFHSSLDLAQSLLDSMLVPLY